MEATIERLQVDRLKRKLVDSLGWGELESWTHRDFQNLSQLIFDTTKEQVSVTTLKRLLGKVEYSGLPYQHTLDIVAHFLGYKSWLEFTREQNTEDKQTAQVSTSNGRKQRTLWQILIFTVVTLIAIGWLWWKPENKPTEEITKKGVLRSTNAISDSFPHTVTFYYEIPTEYQNNQNIISLGEREGVKLLPNEKPEASYVSHTYTKPGYYLAKIFSNKMQLAEQPVLIETNGWICRAYQFEKTLDVKLTRKPGTLTLSPADLARSNIDTNNKFNLAFNLFKDLDLDGDNMRFSTKVRSKANWFNGYIPKVQLKILFANKPIFITLDSSPTSNTIYNQFSNVVLSLKDQKKHFRKSIQDWTKIEVVTKNHVSTVFANGEKIYSTPYQDNLGKLKGIEFRFRGLGEVDDLRIANNEGLAVWNEKF